jgi:hypothetical protein
MPVPAVSDMCMLLCDAAAAADAAQCAGKARDLLREMSSGSGATGSAASSSTDSSSPRSSSDGGSSSGASGASGSTGGGGSSSSGAGCDAEAAGAGGMLRRETWAVSVQAGCVLAMWCMRVLWFRLQCKKNKTPVQDNTAQESSKPVQAPPVQYLIQRACTAHVQAEPVTMCLMPAHPLPVSSSQQEYSRTQGLLQTWLRHTGDDEIVQFARQLQFSVGADCCVLVLTKDYNLFGVKVGRGGGLRACIQCVDHTQTWEGQRQHTRAIQL